MLKEIISTLVDKGVTTNNVKSAIHKLSTIQKRFANENVKKINEHLKKIEDKNAKILEKEHRKKKASGWGVSVRELGLLERKAQAILSSFWTGYSMGDYKRLLVNGHAFATKNDCRSYAKSCTFKPKRGEVTINLTMKEFRSITCIGGVWTIVGKETKASNKVSHCKVLVHSGGRGSYEVVMKNMYLTSDFHTDTIEACLVWRSEQAERLRNSRVRVNNERELLNRAKELFVSFDDSLNVGNCKIGSEVFCNRYGLDKSHGYRLDYLLSLEPENTYLKRLLKLIPYERN